MFYSVGFNMSNIGVPCGTLTLEEKGSYVMYNVTPLSLVNSDAGMASVEFTTIDGEYSFQTEAGIYNHQSGQVQVYIDPELDDMLIVTVFGD